ncbi:bifunctional diaminohydroxyphosphoribosylaminopyrimidine deaminase/5-amino-6-(5-phosphoribosylamino)uracil reductase RibD [Hyphobacterium sp.]|uniref:bifunctional diaminohydroxyphosphoribosylaminopyrimidine deaminase/5-amino-6-(5-phosphoribosylamino)uracil reductase RibD n=1 Tax=Hyphobacterium sp. TaxID=2004662 RepID=UPI003B51E146
MSRLSDLRWMDTALALARSGLGTTAPNPSVGCVIVQQNSVVGRGITASGGRPHAERIALDEAGAAARGASVYVSLEPCAHFGQTPPCADALIDAGVARVFVACRDPDPRTAGQGLARLEGAGIAVAEGLRQDAAETLNAGFFSRVLKQRPLFAIDAEPGGYDIAVETPGETTTEDWTKALFEAGWTRVRLVPGSDAAQEAMAAGIVDAIRA